MAAGYGKTAIGFDSEIATIIEVVTLGIMSKIENYLVVVPYYDLVDENYCLALAG